jgi:hypothetical protein
MRPITPSDREEEYCARRACERRPRALAEQHVPLGAEAYQQEVAVAQCRCPKCGTVLVERHYKGIEIDQCSRCQGLWLDCGELDVECL